MMYTPLSPLPEAKLPLISSYNIEILYYIIFLGKHIFGCSLYKHKVIDMIFFMDDDRFSNNSIRSNIEREKR